MRSRYSAFVLQNERYLLATWHPSTRPSSLNLKEEAPDQWLGLSVKSTSQNGDQGTVSFVARWKNGGKASRLSETSRFVREDGRWYYVDGDTELR